MGMSIDTGTGDFITLTDPYGESLTCSREWWLQQLGDHLERRQDFACFRSGTKTFVIPKEAIADYLEKLTTKD